MTKQCHIQAYYVRIPISCRQSPLGDLRTVTRLQQYHRTKFHFLGVHGMQWYNLRWEKPCYWYVPAFQGSRGSRPSGWRPIVIRTPSTCPAWWSAAPLSGEESLIENSWVSLGLIHNGVGSGGFAWDRRTGVTSSLTKIGWLRRGAIFRCRVGGVGCPINTYMYAMVERNAAEGQALQNCCSVPGVVFAIIPYA